MDKILYLKECLVNGQMDFVGQKQAYYIMLAGIWTSGAIGFVHGYLAQSFLLTSYYIMGGSLFFSLICIPSWPFFITHRVKWQPSPVELAEVPKEKEDASASGDEDAKDKEKPKATKRKSAKKRGGDD